MSAPIAPIEPGLEALMRPLFGGNATPGTGRVFFNVAPLGVPVTPYLLMQHAGGVPVSGFCGDGRAQNARIQFWVWGSSAVEAMTLMRQIAALVTAAPYRAVSLSQPVAEYNEPTGGYGVRQDFSFWYYSQ